MGSEIRKKGADLFVIGNGTVAQAAQLKDEFHIDFDILVDSRLDAYRAAGLRRSIWSTLGPKGLLNYYRAWRAGIKPTGLQGDPWQQGGAFIIAPGGVVKFSYKSGAAGDHARPADLVTALL